MCRKGGAKSDRIDGYNVYNIIIMIASYIKIRIISYIMIWSFCMRTDKCMHARTGGVRTCTHHDCACMGEKDIQEKTARMIFIKKDEQESLRKMSRKV
jgi:NADH:ubiquinone oxidoreductase subunit E